MGRKKFRNKYRIPSTRLQNWDYGWNGAYFITICTLNREFFLGDIVDGEMKLSEIGEMANKFWLEIPEHFPFVKLDVHVVMPNHVHGIIVIDKTDDGHDELNDKCNHGGNEQYVEREVDRNVDRNAETQNFASLPSMDKQQPKNKFGPQSKNLASIIRGYKTGVTKYARKKNIEFAWQSRFHDHIIRDDESYQRIRNYIINNPKKWDDDSLKG